jgi:hypothetical protein
MTASHRKNAQNEARADGTPLARLADGRITPRRRPRLRSPLHLPAQLRVPGDEIYEKVKKILLARITAMDRISRELVRKETLERAELEQLIAAAEADAARNELVAGIKA